MDTAQSHTSVAMDPRDAWQMVLGQLRVELSRALYETWVEPLRPLSYQDKVFTLGVANPYHREWIEARLKNNIARKLEGLYGEALTVAVVVNNSFYTPTYAPVPFEPAPANPAGEPPAEKSPEPAAEGEKIAAAGSRKALLQRAYGSRRAAIIQPERGMFLTQYFFNRWLPLLGHSAATVVLAARSMCYWNPLTGELRNTVETDMAELARRAAVSLRTVKDVLANELIQHFFLRYRVRRIMTPNGVRTAGILLQVRMDDPLTPEDQTANNLPEDERWYSAEFEADFDL